MPSTSPARFVEDCLAQALGTIAGFTVTRVAMTRPTAAATTVYGYITSVTMTDAFENGESLNGTAVARCIVEVVGNASGEGQAPTGKKTEAMYDAIYKVIKAIYDYDVETAGANDDGSFICRLESMSVGSHDGELNDGGTQFGAGVEVFVRFYISRK
jgi:hypothetical protein